MIESNGEEVTVRVPVVTVIGNVAGNDTVRKQVVSIALGRNVGSFCTGFFQVDNSQCFVEILSVDAGIRSGIALVVLCPQVESFYLLVLHLVECTPAAEVTQAESFGSQFHAAFTTDIVERNVYQIIA